MSGESAAVLTAIDGVEGWLSADQATVLWRMAARCAPGDTVVEIGSFRGRSTVALALAAPAGCEVVAIDPHAGTDRGPNERRGFAAAAAADRAALRANLERAGVIGRVRHVADFSHRAHGAVGGEVAVLFVDGAHRYGAARRDIAEWGARVRPGGTMLVHDAFSSVGVTVAIVRTLLAGGRFRYAGRVASLAIYHADLDGTTRSRLVNAVSQIAELPWFVRNVALKVALTLGGGRIMRRFGRPVPEWPY